MTELQNKIEIVQQYILARKGKVVRIVFKQNQSNNKELELLDIAYQSAINWFRKR